MSTVSVAGSGTSTYVSLALHTRVRTSLGLTSPAATAPVANGTGSASDQAFSAFAQAILAVLPAASASDSTSTPSSTSDTADPTTVANALAAALGASGNGAGGPAALLKQIEAAIASASTSLVQSGASADAVKGFASQFRTQLSQALDSLAASLNSGAAASPPATSGQPAPSSADGTTPADPSTGSATYQVTEKGTIRLQTQEGDIVTIRLRNSATLTYSGTGSTSATGAAAYAAQSSHGSSRFSVSVQGNLNSDELGAIDQVLHQVDTLASQFFSGNFADAFATAASLTTDPTEIARVSIRLSESESLKVVAPSSPAPAPATPVSTTPSPDPSSALGGTGPTPAVPTTGSGASTDVPASTDTSTDATPTASSVPTTGATPTPASTDGTSAPGTQSLFDAIFAYLKDVMAQLGETTQSGSVTISAKAKLELLAGAVVGASLTVRESSGASFLKSITNATADSGTPAAGAPSAS